MERRRLGALIALVMMMAGCGSENEEVAQAQPKAKKVVAEMPFYLGSLEDAHAVMAEVKSIIAEDTGRRPASLPYEPALTWKGVCPVTGVPRPRTGIQAIRRATELAWEVSFLFPPHLCVAEKAFTWGSAEENRIGRFVLHASMRANDRRMLKSRDSWFADRDALRIRVAKDVMAFRRGETNRLPSCEALHRHWPDFTGTRYENGEVITHCDGLEFLRPDLDFDELRQRFPALEPEDEGWVFALLGSEAQLSAEAAEKGEAHEDDWFIVENKLQSELYSISDMKKILSGEKKKEMDDYVAVRDLPMAGDWRRGIVDSEWFSRGPRADVGMCGELTFSDEGGEACFERQRQKRREWVGTNLDLADQLYDGLFEVAASAGAEEGRVEKPTDPYGDWAPYLDQRVKDLRKEMTGHCENGSPADAGDCYRGIAEAYPFLAQLIGGIEKTRARHEARFNRSVNHCLDAEPVDPTTEWGVTYGPGEFLKCVDRLFRHKTNHYKKTDSEI
jgi:hypothetical protein